MGQDSADRCLIDAEVQHETGVVQVPGFVLSVDARIHLDACEEDRFDLGARSINFAAVEAFADAPYRVLHACGERDFEALTPLVPGPGYDLQPYIDGFGDALAACTVCVARAGGSIFEVAAHGKPVLTYVGALEAQEVAR